MHLFNRIVVTLLAALLAVGGAFVLGASYGWADARTLGELPALVHLASWLRDFPALYTAGGGMASVFTGLIVLYLELRVPDRNPGMVIQRDKLGSTTVSLAGLKRLAEHVIGEIQGVDAIRAEAREGRTGVEYFLRVVLNPETSAPDVSEEIRARLGATISHHLGRRASRIEIHTQVGTAQVSRRRVR